MGSQVHYEVFRRVGARGGWSLHDVRSAREDALTLAEELMAGEKATGVKVVKETYNDETGDYLSLKIFEEGHNQVKVAAAGTRRRVLVAAAAVTTVAAVAAEVVAVAVTTVIVAKAVVITVINL